jgi:hypothetical protein
MQQLLHYRSAQQSLLPSCNQAAAAAAQQSVHLVPHSLRSIALHRIASHHITSSHVTPQHSAASLGCQLHHPMLGPLLSGKDSHQQKAVHER